VGTSWVVVERYAYDAFGVFFVLDPTWGSRTSSLYDWTYLHQCGRWDADAGLYSFRHREYSPRLGRWLQLDPIGFSADDPNTYRYVANQPVTHSDPSGLSVYWDYWTVQNHWIDANSGGGHSGALVQRRSNIVKFTVRDRVPGGTTGKFLHSSFTPGYNGAGKIDKMTTRLVLDTRVTGGPANNIGIGKPGIGGLWPALPGGQAFGETILAVTRFDPGKYKFTILYHLQIYAEGGYVTPGGTNWALGEINSLGDDEQAVAKLLIWPATARLAPGATSVIETRPRAGVGTMTVSATIKSCADEVDLASFKPILVAFGAGLADAQATIHLIGWNQQ